MSAERTERTESVESTEGAERALRGAFDHVGPFEVRGVLGAGADTGTSETSESAAAEEAERYTVIVGWKDGEIYGDDVAVMMMGIEARVFDGYLVGPSNGPYTETAEAHLASPGSAYELMKGLLSGASVIKGKAPRPLQVPGMVR